MTKSSNKIKISCVNGKPVEITENYAEGIRLQIVRHIKNKRRNHELARRYYYGLAEYRYIEENDSTVLSITYGDVLSSINLDKKNKIYVEVPFREKPISKKKVKN